MIDAPTAAGVLLVLAALWYVFLRGGNGGCTAHHFGSATPTHETNSTTHYPVRDIGVDYRVQIARKYIRKCQHEGCGAREVEWREERDEVFSFA